MNPDITVFQAITLAIAALGAVLGIINTWHAIDRTRIKLKVSPSHAIPVGNVHPSIRFCVEITNLSSFAVTVCEVGVTYSGKSHRGCITHPIFLDGGPWPRRLEPRTSVTIYSQLPYSEAGEKIENAYVKTQCGHLETGMSPALRQISDAQFQR